MIKIKYCLSFGLLLTVCSFLVTDFYLYTQSLVKPVKLEIKSVSVFNVPEDMMHSSEWTSLENRMEETDSKVIFLNWKGDGGLYDSVLMQFIVHIKNLQRKGKIIIFNLVGDSFSAHTYAVCNGDYILNNDKYFLMFHPMVEADMNAEKIQYKAVTDQETIDEYKTILGICKDKGIITQSEINRAVNNTEVYIKVYKNGSRSVQFLPDLRQKN